LKGDNLARRGPYEKGKIKRHEILMSAIEVFSRRGYDGASIREIAEGVGLTQAGIFHYFASKEELFVEVLRVREELGEARNEDILKALRLSIAHNAKVEGLVHLFVTVSAQAIDSAHPGHEYFASRYDRLVDLLGARIEAGKTDQGMRSELDPLSAAQMLVAIADGLQLQWLLNPQRTDMLKIFDQFCDILLAARAAGNATPTRSQSDGDVGRRPISSRISLKSPVAGAGGTAKKVRAKPLRSRSSH
jgi:AcrR family transcriptional regulator